MAAWAAGNLDTTIQMLYYYQSQSQTSTLDGLLSDTLTATELIKYMSILGDTTAKESG